VSALKGKSLIARVMEIVAPKVGLETVCAMEKIKAGGAISGVTKARLQIALNQQPLHQCAGTGSVMVMKHTKRALMTV
jgi:hypothetical protein